MSFARTIKSCALATSLLLPMLANAQSPSDRDIRMPDPPMLGAHLAKGVANNAANHQAGTSSANLNYHGGPTMNKVSDIKMIFWGTSWKSYSGDKITGLQSFYSGMNNSNYGATTDEYTPAITDSISIGSSGYALYDYSAAPSNAPATGTIATEVCKVLSANGVTPQANGYYPVYIDQPRGTAGYCAWHSNTTCGGVPVAFAFFFKLDGDAGCDPQSPVTSESQGLAALANVSGHELSEARTDVDGNAWYDRQGNENADKCAWVFPHPYLTFSNGTQWRVQPNWSNNAYNSQTGYANSKGQKGCIDGN